MNQTRKWIKRKKQGVKDISRNKELIPKAKRKKIKKAKMDGWTHQNQRPQAMHASPAVPVAAAETEPRMQWQLLNKSQ